MDNKTLDYLPGTNIYLYQRKDMFRMNTDTALLGHFMNIHPQEKVLDIGTNNGALLLYANQFQPGFLYGIDIQKDACQLAEENMKYHHITHAEIIHGDIQSMNLEKVDVIVCNPPYFKMSENSNVNENESLRYARHEVYLSLQKLLPCVQRLLLENGRFYLIHRSDRIADIICGLRDINMEVKQIQFVYDENKNTARSVLIEAIKQGKSHCNVLKPQIITR